MFFRTAWLVLRKDVAIEAKSWEVLTTTLFFAVSCVLIFAFALVKDGAGGGRRGRRHSVDCDQLFRDAGARPHLRARALWRDAARAAAGAGAARRPLRGQASRHAGAARFGRAAGWSRSWRCCFRRPRSSAGRCCSPACSPAARSVSARWARCSPRCWSARGRATCCWPILLYPIIIPVIIAGVRGTAALLGATPDEPTAIMWIGVLAAFDIVFVTLALWTFEPLMTE